MHTGDFDIFGLPLFGIRDMADLKLSLGWPVNATLFGLLSSRRYQRRCQCDAEERKSSTISFLGRDLPANLRSLDRTLRLTPAWNDVVAKTTSATVTGSYRLIYSIR